MDAWLYKNGQADRNGCIMQEKWIHEWINWYRTHAWYNLAKRTDNYAYSIIAICCTNLGEKINTLVAFIEMCIILRQIIGTTRTTKRPTWCYLNKENKIVRCENEKASILVHWHFLFTLSGGFLVMCAMRKFIAISSQFISISTILRTAWGCHQV